MADARSIVRLVCLIMKMHLLALLQDTHNFGFCVISTYINA